MSNGTDEKADGSNAGVRPYSQGIMSDGPVILCEGNPMTPDQIVEALNVYDQLVTARDKVLSEIPPCEVHGHQCIPHAIDWIKEKKA